LRQAPQAPAVAVAGAPTGARRCPVCSATRKDHAAYCDDCGYMFGPNDDLPGGNAKAVSASPSDRIKGRYELQVLVGERGGVERFRGFDHATGQPVVIIRGAIPQMAQAVLLDDEPAPAQALEEDMLPSFEDALPVANVEGGPGSAWPSVAWEASILEKAKHPALPGILDSFTEGGQDYLIEEALQGRVVWDAWYDLG